MENLSIQVEAKIENLKKGLKDAGRDVKTFANNTVSDLGRTGNATKNLEKGLSASSQTANFLRGRVSGVTGALVDVGAAATKTGKAMKSALISSGIGLALVIVGEIADNWEKIVGFISGANDKLKEQKRLNESINKELDRQKFLRELNEGLIDTETEFSILRAKIAGKSEAQIAKIRIDGAKKFLAETKRNFAEANQILKNSVKADEKEYRQAVKNQEEATKKVVEANRNLTRVILQEQLTRSNAIKKAFEQEKKEYEKSFNETKKFSDKLSELVNNIKIKAENFTIKPLPPLVDPIKLSDSERQYLAHLERLKQLVIDFGEDSKNLIQGSVANAFSSIGESIGNALANGGNAIKAFGNAILGAFGNFLSDLGKMMIQYGTAGLAMSIATKALTNPITAGPAAAALIAAGTALTIIGSAITSRLNRGFSGSNGVSRSNGSNSRVTSGTTTGLSSKSIFGGEIVLKAKGRDLVGVIRKENVRNRNFGSDLSFG